MRKIFSTIFLFLILAIPANFLYAFAFIFAGSANGLDLVMHPLGYSGTGGVINISVGIDPTSANAASMQVSTANVVATFNSLTESTGNLIPANVPFSEYDFESVLLHELGHSLGLAHCNAATESGLTGADRNYTKAEEGVNATFDLDDGADNVIGSSDDIRGDDENLHWFRTSNNNPFTIAGTVDGTTYSVDLADLPVGHTFPANADRDVSTLLGLGASPQTEAVMQQATFNGEAQRTLGHDDVAGLKYAMAGVDEIAGTADDYSINLTYAGLDASADIVLDYDNAMTGFASSSSSANFIAGTGNTHARITGTSIFFNTTAVTWFFNTAVLPVDLLSFEAKDESGNAQLQWVTTEEVDHDYFEVQRSLNADDWAFVGRVESQPNTVDGGKRFYTFKDDQFGQYGERVYYRIAFVSLDGDFSYSPIKAVSYFWENHSQVSLARIPFQENTTLEVWLDRETEISYKIYSLDGKEILRNSFSGFEGTNSFPLGLNQSLPTGVYVIKVSIGTATRTIKFLAE